MGVITAFLAFLLLLAPAARAGESAPVVSERLTASLVSDTDAVAPGAALRVGLLLRMAPGWHTYWRNPGDAGVAPTLAFTLPPGETAGPIAWPAPRRDAEGPLMTYGYTGTVLLPVTISGATGATPVRLHATWLVCAQICVPEQGDFSLFLPAGTPTASAQAPLFAASDALVPRASPWQARVAPDGALSVTGAGLSPASVRRAWFIPDSYGAIQDSAPQPLSVRDGGFSLALTPGTKFKPSSGLAGVLVVQDRTGQQTALQIAASPGPAAAAVSWPQIIGFALLGGLILNLMPCVFPVLAMKAIGLAGLAGKGRRHASAHALAYTLGVVSTFMLLGLALLAARAAGTASGWGFQFQSPVFVGAIACLLFAVGLNLSGVFAVGVPAGAGQKLAAHGGAVGSFFTGLLAVLVASPCTAPFMAAAVAAGLAGTMAQTLAVFAAMGLGLAAPYVLLAAVPGFARALPRPGRWMDILKQALAFPMYAATAWLVWVASQQAGPDGVLVVAASLVLIGFAGWVLGLAQSGGRRWLGRGLAGLAGLAAVLVLSSLAAAPRPAEAAGAAFSPARLAALQAQGRPVFVNMTAAWCVSCLVNERVALGSERVRQGFAAHDVAVLTGDWTSGEPAITAFLRDHGRDGVPLYLLYPPGGGAPVVLPQILTPGIVLAALDRLGG
jgi:thiol:disulfide interchange protein